jgi:cell division septal protein FtsQ
LDLPFTHDRRPALPGRSRAGEGSSAKDEDGESPFLRPRQRTRMQRARRRPFGRATLALHLGAIVCILGIVVWQGYSRVMASERLKVAKLEVRGEHFLSEGEVRELLGPAVGENILALDIESLKQRLRASPWVGGAHVERSLPDTLRVDIEERQPIALAEIDRLYLMDAEGSLIEIYGPRTSAFDLPIVRGLGGLAPEDRRDRAREVAALVAELGDLSSELSELRVLPSRDLEAILRGGEVVRLGASAYRKQFVTFLGLRVALRERCPNAELFDLRFRDRIYVQERGGAVVQAASQER